MGQNKVWLLVGGLVVVLICTCIGVTGAGLVAFLTIQTQSEGQVVVIEEANAIDSQSPVLFFDDFTNTKLNNEAWRILKQEGVINVSDGILSLSESTPTGGTHKRLDTIQSFSPTQDGGVSAKARIMLDGDFQKFGFRINAIRYNAPIAGLYFDTIQEPGRENVINLRVVDTATDSTALTYVLDEEIPVSWGEFHEFEVVWQESTGSFYIDGELKREVSINFTGNLPVGVWNDREQIMLVDWVEVKEVR